MGHTGIVCLLMSALETQCHASGSFLPLACSPDLIVREQQTLKKGQSIYKWLSSLQDASDMRGSEETQRPWRHVIWDWFWINFFLSSLTLKSVIRKNWWNFKIACSLHNTIRSILILRVGGYYGVAEKNGYDLRKCTLTCSGIKDNLVCILLKSGSVGEKRKQRREMISKWADEYSGILCTFGIFLWGVLCAFL